MPHAAARFNGRSIRKARRAAISCNCCRTVSDTCGTAALGIGRVCRIAPFGIWQHTGQLRSLSRRQVGCINAKIMDRGGLYAKHTLVKFCDVQIKLDDPAF